MAKGKKRDSEINASSMADIAFLLLIFFLVTTTIDTDKGIPILLPPIPEEDEQIDLKLKERNILKILVNSKDQILCEGEPIKINKLCQKAQDFIDNKNRTQDPNLAEAPEKAVISLKNDRGTSYEMYIAVQNELKRAYNELRNKFSKSKYGESYDELKKRAEDIDNPDEVAKEKVKEIRAYYRQVISEAEPEDLGTE